MIMARATKKPATRKKASTTRAKRARRSTRRVLVLVATRKGAWLLHGDAARKTWRVDGPHFLGHIVNHVVLDPRDGRPLLAAAKTGHLGPTIFRSTNLGRTWKEAARPPAFAKAPDGEKGRAVDPPFWLPPPPPSLLRQVGRRRARNARPRPNLDSSRKRDGSGRGVRRRQYRLPRSPLRPALSEQPGPAVPAESLRHLPAPTGRHPKGTGWGQKNP